MSRLKSFFGRIKDGVEWALALKVTENERLSYASGYEFFEGGVSNRRPTQVAVALAVLFHVVLFLVTFPSWVNQTLQQTEQVLVLKDLAPAGGGERPKAAPPKVVPTQPKPQPILVPIPDPTPMDPEPIPRMEVTEVQQVVTEISADLSIGDITAPPGPPGRGDGRGSTQGEGAGVGPGGSGVHQMGELGITDPEILVQTVPSYTDDAIKAKVQGVVLLQAIIRKNGRVDSPVVLRGLGYGLEEKAIQEIVANWRFRPATLNGSPVDLQATIEVTFNLR